EGRPQNTETNGLLRARSALRRQADRSRRQAECRARDRDWQWRIIEARGRPTRPKHIADIAERAERYRCEHEKRRHEMTAIAAPKPTQVLAALSAEVNRRHRAPPGESRITHHSSAIRLRCVLTFAARWLRDDEGFE